MMDKSKPLCLHCLRRIRRDHANIIFTSLLCASELSCFGSLRVEPPVSPTESARMTPSALEDVNLLNRAQVDQGAPGPGGLPQDA